MEILSVAPEKLRESEYHVRGSSSVSERFVRSVSRIGIIQPPIVRRQDDDLFSVIDGLRRVEAARQANMSEVDVLVIDIRKEDVLETSLTSNLTVWNKSVSKNDREPSLRKLVGGDERTVKEWESKDEIHEAKYYLGIHGEIDKISRKYGSIGGVGETLIQRLRDEFETLEDIEQATVSELSSVKGIGKTTAEKIRDN